MYGIFWIGSSCEYFYPSVSRRRVGLTRGQEFSLRAGQLAPLGSLHQLKLL